MNDLTGRSFGLLCVVSVERRGGHYCRHWRCRCECGNEVIVRGDNLITGNTVSCGCVVSARMDGERRDRADISVRGDVYTRIRELAAAAGKSVRQFVSDLIESSIPPAGATT